MEERYIMVKQTSKEQLLRDIYTERRWLEKNLFALSAEEMIQPGVNGIWSVKDILAHLVAWEDFSWGGLALGFKVVRPLYRQ
jgi:uncharacterized damage-inducible protein DinB